MGRGNLFKVLTLLKVLRACALWRLRCWHNSDAAVLRSLQSAAFCLSFCRSGQRLEDVTRCSCNEAICSQISMAEVANHTATMLSEASRTLAPLLLGEPLLNNIWRLDHVQP